jgi:putative transposase
MPRKARFFLPKIPVHLVIRGNSRKTIFAEQEDYQSYLQWLLERSVELDCKIYSYGIIGVRVKLI